MTGPRQNGSSAPEAQLSEAQTSDARLSEAQREVEGLRAELGDTVEELVHRVDVPQRLREKRAETTERVRAQVIHAREAVAERAPAVQNALRDRPLVVGGALAALLFLLVCSVRRRNHRKEDA